MIASKLFTAIVCGLFATSAIAYPSANPKRGHKGHKGGNSKSLQDVDMPPSSLPAPSGMALKFFTLGIGTQNYTCNSSVKATDVPSSGGALADLYDLSPLVSSPVTGPMIDGLIPVIPPMALEFSANNDGIPVQLQNMGVPAAPIGRHTFSPSLVPKFDLTTFNAGLSAAKSGQADAPPTACPGLTSEGAVPWLYLTDNGDSYGDIKAGYRLETAGGKSPATCEGIGGDGKDGHMEVKYAAEYWFYG